MTKKEKVFEHLNKHYEDKYSDLNNKSEIARQINEAIDLQSNANTLRDYVRLWIKENVTDKDSKNSKSKKDNKDSKQSITIEFKDMTELIEFDNLNSISKQDRQKVKIRKNFWEIIGEDLQDWHFVSTDQARKKVDKPEKHLFCMYNLDERVYYFNFPGDSNLTNVVATFSQIRELIESYVYYGRGKTRKECTRIMLNDEFAEKHGDIVRDINSYPIKFSHTKKILRALGIDKNSHPYPPHDIREKTREEIIHTWREKDESYIEQKKLETDAKYWKKRYEKIISQKMDIQRMLSEVTNELPDGDIRIDIEPVSFDSGKPYDLCLILADWHIGQTSDVITNAYNKTVFNKRIKTLKSKIHNWLHTHNRPINNCWIIINGDMIDGPNGTMRPGQQYEQDLFYNEQTRVGSRKISEVISYVRGLLPSSIPISIQAVPGNHGRSTKNREWDPYRVIELATYQISEAITENLENLQWSISKEIFQDWLIDYYECTTQVIQTHGDRTYKDFKSHIEAIMDKRAQYHLLTSGHYHHENIKEELDKLGVQSGSLAGDESYGLHRLAVGSRPSQRIMMIDNDGPYIPGQLIVDNLARPTRKD